MQSIYWTNSRLKAFPIYNLFSFIRGFINSNDKLKPMTTTQTWEVNWKSSQSMTCTFKSARNHIFQLQIWFPSKPEACYQRCSIKVNQRCKLIQQQDAESFCLTFPSAIETAAVNKQMSANPFQIHNSRNIGVKFIWFHFSLQLFRSKQLSSDGFLNFNLSLMEQCCWDRVDDCSGRLVQGKFTWKINGRWSF